MSRLAALRIIGVKRPRAIVNCASILGLTGQHRRNAYDATKVITFSTANFDATDIGGRVMVEAINATGNRGPAACLHDKVAASDRPSS